MHFSRGLSCQKLLFCEECGEKQIVKSQISTLVNKLIRALNYFVCLLIIFWLFLLLTFFNQHVFANDCMIRKMQYNSLLFSILKIKVQTRFFSYTYVSVSVYVEKVTFLQFTARKLYLGHYTYHLIVKFLSRQKVSATSSFFFLVHVILCFKNCL